MVGCGNARLFVSLKLEITISVATVHQGCILTGNYKCSNKPGTTTLRLYYLLLVLLLLLLQPSTAIANQLPGHLVSIQIGTIGLNCFNSIDSAQHKDCTNNWMTGWFYASYIIRLAFLEQSLLSYWPLNHAIIISYMHLYLLHSMEILVILCHTMYMFMKL